MTKKVEVINQENQKLKQDIINYETKDKNNLSLIDKFKKENSSLNNFNHNFIKEKKDLLNKIKFLEESEKQFSKNILEKSNNSQNFIVTTNSFDRINNRFGYIRFISTIQCSDNDYECIKSVY